MYGPTIAALAAIAVLGLMLYITGRMKPVPMPTAKSVEWGWPMLIQAALMGSGISAFTNGAPNLGAALLLGVLAVGLLRH